MAPTDHALIPLYIGRVSRPSRRRWLATAGLATAGLAGLAAVLPATDLAAQRKDTSAEDDVAPPEDLMREHGVLNRILLIYEEAIRRIDARHDLPPAAVHDAAQIVRTFIEEYHEKLEEDYLFPRFEKARRLTDLTAVLRAQHQAGRRVTERVTQLATLQTVKDPASAGTLATLLRQFVRMYRPHEAREDTVLFPAIRDVVSKHEFAALGEEFEKKEHQLFGDKGFEGMVERVAGIEKTLGLYDLAQFTPPA